MVRRPSLRAEVLLKLYFDGMANTSSVFSDVATLASGDPLVLTLQADTLDLSQIDSGHFD